MVSCNFIQYSWGILEDLELQELFASTKHTDEYEDGR